MDIRFDLKWLVMVSITNPMEEIYPSDLEAGTEYA
jgi:hypothetical protein